MKPLSVGFGILFFSVVAACSSTEVGLDTGRTAPGGATSSSGGVSHSDGGTSSGGAATSGGSSSSDLVDLFPNAEREPTNVRVEDGWIVTRVADRGRRRHEPSCISGALNAGPDTCDFDNYHFMYWTRNARTLDWTIRDGVAAGHGSIEFEVDMKGPHGQNGADAGQNSPNLRCFTQYGTVTGFYQNYVMEPVNGSVATATIFRRIISSYSDPTNGGANRPLAVGDFVECELTMRWQELVERGFQANYYSRRLRFVVGTGGLVGFNRDPNVGPVSLVRGNLLGGGTTDTVRAPGERGRSYMQFALNGSHDELVSFLDGRRLFRTSFVDGVHQDPTGTHDPAAAQPTFEEAALGVTPPFPDAAARCSNCHLNDGNGPRFEGMARAAPALVGLGLLEAIRVDDLLENERAQAAGGVVRGTVRREERDGRVLAGRFGWTADAVSVEEQVERALVNEMGVDAASFPDEFLTALVDYVRLLGVPAPRAENLAALPGRDRFEEFGCGDCHTSRTYVTGSHPLQSLRGQTIVPYTDLLVDDTGGEEPYRTSPLWGVGLRATVRGEARYLHDDSATSLTAAILAHGGEATPSVAAFVAASETERAELLAFLEAL